MIVILGSGFAGYTVAEKIRQLDADVPITMLTDTHGDFFPKPQLSVSFDRKRHANELVTQSGSEKAAALKMELIPHCQIERIDVSGQKVICEDRTVSYSQLIYALGSSAIELPVVQSDIQDRVHTLNTLADYQRLSDVIATGRPRMGIVGCGFIGYELISTFSRCQIDMKVFHDQPYALNMLLPEKAQQYATDAIKGHCDLYPLFSTTSIVGSEKELIVSDGSQEVVVDEVVMAVGVRPNVSVAIHSGLPTDRHGLVVNQWGQVEGTNNVWALGDCASFAGRSFRYIAFGRYMADVVAHNIVSDHMRSLTHRPFPYSVKSTLCPISVMGDMRDDLPWQWDNLPQGLVGKQYDNGLLSAWCLCGDEKAQKALLTKEMLSQSAI